MPKLPDFIRNFTIKFTIKEWPKTQFLVNLPHCGQWIVFLALSYFNIKI